MNVTRAMLRHLIEHAGSAYKGSDLARAAGCSAPNQIAAAPACMNSLYQAKAISRRGEGRGSLWLVENTAIAKERARAYLTRPERGKGRAAGNPFNRDTAPDETPREHAFPPVPSIGFASFPPEPLRFTIDDDGDLQITGRNTGTCYLLIPKLDAVDLLEFARRSAPHLEAA